MSNAPNPAGDSSSPRRLFIHEPGWRIGRKAGSTREFCYAMAPGQDYYHRLLDGEIFVYHGDERLCLACAERRGLLSYEPRGLKEPPTILEVEIVDRGSENLFPESNGDRPAPFF